MRVRPRLAPLVAALVSSSCSGASSDERGPRGTATDAAAARPASSPRPTIRSGKVRRWPEATKYLRLSANSEGASAELGDPRPSGLDVLWSIATTTPAAGFFYADSIRGTAEARVAWAKDAARVSDIRDASALELRRGSVGPVPASGIVVLEHGPTRRYLALVVDAIERAEPPPPGAAGPYAYADVTWYLTEPDEADFGPSR